ncbi:MAG: sialate O-acetylesterase [Prevotella sp.]|nr:sialate O-acetylesterase [Prevotella sp.]
MKKGLLLFVITLLFAACAQKPEGHKVVVCIPVYGQSLALGEEAERITDFDSLASYANGRIVTENLDHQFGYFDNDDLKRIAKKVVKYQKRSFELSIYTMAQRLADQLGEDTLICIFPGGQGATIIKNLSKGSIPYQEFMEDIETAYQQATENGWDFVIPAICWMQGESDIEDYPDTSYPQQFIKIWEDMNVDIRQITQYSDTICFICYQPNNLSRASGYRAKKYECVEASVPQTFVNVLHDNKWFWASGPTYPYSCVGEKLHIDAIGQQHVGELAARSALGIIRGKGRNKGLIPTSLSTDNQDIIIHFNITNSPLIIDTTQVRKAENYGFSVITKDNRNIATSATLKGDSIIITCSEIPQNCKVRYAVNGDPLKSGNQHGPRGNLRDSSGNWCYLFDQPL